MGACLSSGGYAPKEAYSDRSSAAALGELGPAGAKLLQGVATPNAAPHLAKQGGAGQSPARPPVRTSVDASSSVGLQPGPSPRIQAVRAPPHLHSQSQVPHGLLDLARHAATAQSSTTKLLLLSQVASASSAACAGNAPTPSTDAGGRGASRGW